MIKHFWAKAYPEDVRKLNALVEAPVTRAEDLKERLTQAHELILGDSLQSHEIVGVRADALDIMRVIFAFRMMLRDKIAGWHREGLMSHEVQIALRGIMRDARYATDMMGELAIDNAPLREGETPHKGFTGDQHNTLLHPKFANADGRLEFRSGDIILVRGQAHNSAAIARIGDVDSQFSHVGMVYIDRHGKEWMVEALIEDGAIINSLDHALSHGISRAILLRHKDEKLAQRAAEIIHDRVLKSQRFYRRHIPYDFTMRLDGYRKLFCAKLVRQAFEKASRGETKLPTFKTRLEMNNRDFLDRIGVKTVETFAPADIEIQPEFDLVAEWRDYRLTSDSRLQDILMDKLFLWMEERQYYFKPDMTIRLISFFGRLSSYLSKGAKEMIEDVVPRVPRNMSARSIGAVAMLHKTAQPLFISLKQQECDCIAQVGCPLHQSEIGKRLEFVRENSPGSIGYLVSKSDSERIVPEVVR